MSTLPPTKESPEIKTAGRSLPAAAKPARRSVFARRRVVPPKRPSRGIKAILLADKPKIDDLMIPSRDEYPKTTRGLDLG